ncbi:hypothetical protein KPH14_003296 [Odynerus spinipes]|uniref:Uncharacterized protein n=1 Tax=Odynerus spinipes TaxID=1348599 RepID=A0AAD9RCI9_9HYME|nr:hypothetical protein KPH14_003296 [Odynerus spinipes]
MVDSVKQDITMRSVLPTGGNVTRYFEAEMRICSARVFKGGVVREGGGFQGGSSINIYKGFCSFVPAINWCGFYRPVTRNIPRLPTSRSTDSAFINRTRYLQKAETFVAFSEDGKVENDK